MATISLLSKCANTLTDSFIVQSWILLTANPSKRDVESNTTPSEKSHQNGTAYLTQWMKKKKKLLGIFILPDAKASPTSQRERSRTVCSRRWGGVRWHQQPQWKSAKVLHPLPHAHTLGRTAGERGAPNGHVRTMRIPGQLPLASPLAFLGGQRAEVFPSTESSVGLFCRRDILPLHEI